MDQMARWIWLPDKAGGLYEAGEWGGGDSKACFRKVLRTKSSADELEVEIWADSRYFLWVNGDFVGFGPVRSWPDKPRKDRYKLKLKSPRSAVSVAVLVWHFGTSTSQYIHGPARLALRGALYSHGGEVERFISDGSWRCAQHQGYFWPVPRVNVSQPWVEMVDSQRFPNPWYGTDFNDSPWQRASILEASYSPSLEAMEVRDLPLLVSRKRVPEKKILERIVHCRGMGIRIDYKSAFYPGDVSTEDRLQTGYLCCRIHTPEDQTLILTLADRIWPEEDERIVLNGQERIFPPGITSVELPLSKGDNLFLLDVAGARQRFTSDLHFRSSLPLRFLPPLDAIDTVFAALGPFQTAAIGNIVCADGFSVDREDALYRQAGRAKNAEALSAFASYLHPIETILFDGVKLRSIGSEEKLLDKAPSSETGSLCFQLQEGEDQEVLLDMGSEVSGFVDFHVEAEAGTELDFRFCEYYAEGVMEIPSDLDSSLRYICAGGEEHYRSILRRGFRYLAVRVRGTGEARIHDLFVDERLYPLSETGAFRCSEAVLEDIWGMCRRTVELCSEDTFVDCPAFEQAYWIGDGYVMSLYHQYLSKDDGLIRRCLRLAAQSMAYTELPDCHLPAGVHLLLTAWAQLWMLACREQWFWTGNSSFLGEFLPYLRKAGMAFRRHLDEKMLLELPAWNLLDWAELDTPYRGKVCHVNARLAGCFRSLAELCAAAGEKKEAEDWKGLATEIALAADTTFWDPNMAAYRDSIHKDGSPSPVFSVQTNLVMLLHDCVPPVKLEAVRSFVADPPEGAVLPGSPFMAHFYYDYLFTQGRGKQALDGIREQWSPMLDQGTCWETFKGFYKDRLTRSYCHAWSSAPIYLYGKWILGVRPLEPGFGKLLITPVPAGLRDASGIVPTPVGDIQVNWSVEGSFFSCEAKIPKGLRWEFQAPPEFGERASIQVIETD